MGVDPFAALGIEQPNVSAEGAAKPGGKSGIDPFATLGIEAPEQYAAPTVAATIQPATGISANIGQGIKQGVIGAISSLADPVLKLAQRFPQVDTSFMNDPNLTEDQKIERYRQSYAEANKGPVQRGLEWMSPPVDVEARTRGERLARAAGEGGAAFAVQAPLFGQRALSQVIPGIVGGMAGEGASEALPGPLKPVGNVVGNMAGAMGVAPIQGSAAAYVRDRFGPRETFSNVDRSVSPINQRRAFNTLDQAMGPEGWQQFDAAQNAEARARALEAIPTRTPEQQAELDSLATQRVNIVPGSTPTTTALAPTPGMKSLDTAARLKTGEAFNAQEADNIGARLGQVRGQAPASMDVQTAETTVGQHFSRFLSDMEDRHAAEIEAFGQRSEAEKAGLAQRQQAEATPAAGAVQQATTAVGGRMSPDETGDVIRNTLQQRANAVKAQIGRVYDAIDPEGTLVVDRTPVQQAAQAIKGQFSPETWQTLGGDFADVKYWVDRVLSGQAGQRYNDFRLDQQQLSAAIRSLRAKGIDPGTPAGHYLGQLKAGLGETLANTIDGTPGLAERLQEAVGGLQQGETGSGQAATVPGSGMAQPGAERGSQGSAAGGPGNASGAPGLAANAAIRGQIPGNLSPLEQGIYGDLAEKSAPRPPPSPLVPNFTPEKAAQLQSANDQYAREYKGVYREGAVGEVLRGGPEGAQYRMEQANLAKKFLTGKANEPGRVQEFLNAVGGEQEATAAMRDALVSDLRQKRVINDDGMVNADKLRDWMRPEVRGRTVDLFPGLRDELGNVETLQRAYDDMMARHSQDAAELSKDQAARKTLMEMQQKAESKEFQGTGGKFTEDRDPQRAIRSLFNSATGASDLAKVIRQARGDQAVIDGLKRIGAEEIEQQITTHKPVTSADNSLSQKLEDYIDQRKEVLRALYGGQGLNNLQMVAADVRRAELGRGSPATRGSSSAHNFAETAKQGVSMIGHSGMGAGVFMLLGEHLAENVGHAISSGHGGVAAAAGVTGAIGGLVIRHLRQAGIETRNQLVAEMIRNPDLTMAMRAKLTKSGDIPPIVQRRIAAALSGSIATQKDQQQ